MRPLWSLLFCFVLFCICVLLLFVCAGTLDPLLLYRLGVLYSRQGEWGAAREVFLQLCTCAPSCSAWMGVAECALQMGDNEGGEAALVQANLLDKSNAPVWAQLALVSLRNNRLQLAHQSLLHALSLGCDDDAGCASVLVEIGSLYASKGYLDLAVSTLQRALAAPTGAAESAAARLCLAQALLRQQRNEEAELQLQHAAAIAHDHQTRAAVHQHWTAVHKLLGRTVPNEQQQQQQQSYEDVASPIGAD